MSKVLKNIGFFTICIFLLSCGGDSSPGYEFMPNMYRSPSIETYEDHTIEGYNGMPVTGTISRNNLSTFIDDSTGQKYSNDNDGYLRAGKIQKYPDGFLEEESTLNDGKKLFGMMCSHCHGEQGKGDGAIAKATFSLNPYTATPAFNDNINIRSRSMLPMSKLKKGHIFHAITYGLNAMGPHASQITEDERWKIVYYIQEELQQSNIDN